MQVVISKVQRRNEGGNGLRQEMPLGGVDGGN